MKISLAEFAALDHPLPVIIWSLEQALYQVTVDMNGEEKLLTENDGSTFRRNGLSAVRRDIAHLPLASLVLRHQSAYDEMVGQPAREGSNRMDLPLSLDSD